MLVSDLLSYCQRLSGVLGVGQVPLAQDTADALTTLSAMLTQWQAKRWLLFRLTELECPAVPGRPTYTVGPGGQIDTGSARRPTDIEAAYVRQLFAGNTGGLSTLPVDYQLTRIDSREEWSRIGLKNLHSWPSCYFYDPTVPTGTFYVYPIPIQNLFELHVTIKPDISAWVQPNVDTQTFLPAEYDEALIYNLAGRLRLIYSLPPSPEIIALARASLETLRSTNLRLQTLGMPFGHGENAGYRKNPTGGFFETNATVPYTVLG